MSYQNRDEKVYEAGNIVWFHFPHLQTAKHLKCTKFASSFQRLLGENRGQSVLAVESKLRPMLVLAKLDKDSSDRMQTYLVLYMTSRPRYIAKRNYIQLKSYIQTGCVSLVKTNEVHTLPQNLADHRKGKLDLLQLKKIQYEFRRTLGYAP